MIMYRRMSLFVRLMSYISTHTFVCIIILSSTGDGPLRVVAIEVMGEVAHEKRTKTPTTLSR
jgi:hypothetical protein